MTYVASPRDVAESPEFLVGGGGTPESYPLTPMQLGMIYDSVMADAPWINLEQLVCRLSDEPVDIATMSRAWADLAARHDILRTAVHWQGRDTPVQVVEPEVTVVLDTVDLSDRPGDAQETMLQDWLAADRLRGCDLNHAPSWRLTWFQLGATRSVLVWTFHHALLDGRSFTALLQEVLDRYAALCAGIDIPCEAAPRPGFGDHCRALHQIDLTAAQAHFSASLAGVYAPGGIDIAPQAGPRPTGIAQPGRKAIVDRVMPIAFGQSLHRKAQASGTTVATLVLAAWGIVVARSTGRAGAVIGVTRSGRHLIEGAESVAGCLINTLPLRVAAPFGATIDTVLHAVRADQLAVRPHEQTPLTEIAGWCGLPGGAALFDSAVMFERATHDSALRARGGVWASRRFEVLEEGALPLSLAVYQDDAMLFRLEHDPSKLAGDVAERLLEYTLNVLSGFVTCPGDTPLALLNMLGRDEAAALDALARPDAGVQPADNPAHCVATGFEAQAARHGGGIALSQAGSPAQLSYAQLNARADQVAGMIMARGVGPGDLVAICLPRSVEFVIAALGILKSGAAFLPIDPGYPAPVIQHMLSDSRSPLMVSNRTCVPESAVDKAILLDRLDPAEPTTQGTPDPTRRDADRTAYVIYTSGSSGAPKGVMVSHRALAAHIAAVSAAYALVPGDRVLQFASLSFDVSIEEILPTLLCGAELVLRSPEMAQSMAELLEQAGALGLTVLNLPTALWHTLVDHMQLSGARLPSGVRLVIVGGEAVSPQALARWRAMQPGLRWLNGYGPTEATITATVYDPAQTGELAEGEDVPIGRPLGHARAYVVAPDGSLAPRGAPGELWLGGAAVAQGYWNRADLTASRFLPAPFLPAPDLPEGDAPRLYRSGDIVRWRGDGALGFGGRADRQVKLRGYRIELREIERALEACEDVGLALAAVDGAGEPTARLLAWVTPARGVNAPDAARLRADLQTRLPPHMVPRIMPLDRFPKTPGGKIDLAALPRPKSVQRSVAAQDEGGADVAAIRRMFREILGQAEVGPDASFFDLGGHSLLAVRLIGQIEMAFGCRLSVAALHAGPSPRAIAQAIGAPDEIQADDYIVPIQPLGSRPPIYGVHVLGSNECFFRPLAEQLGTEQPLLGLSVGPLTPGAPTGVVETASLYARQIQRYQPEGALCLAAVSQGSYIAFELAQQLLATGRDVALLALFDAAGPGGRPMLTGRDRLAAHLRLLRRTGPGYLGTLARNRIDGLRNWSEKSRIKWETRLGLAGTLNPTVEKFVAANTLAIEQYDPVAYPRRITLFRAEDSVFDAPEAIASGLGWRGVAAGGLDLIEVPGGHLSMLQQPHVATLSRHLAGAIGDAA